MTDRRADNALAHIDGATAALGGFMTIMLALTFLASIFGSGSLFGFGSDSVCTEVRAAHHAPFSYPDRQERFGTVGLKENARELFPTTSLCVENPSLSVRSLAALFPGSQLLLFLGSLVLVRRWVRKARHDGLFAPGVATRLGHVGRALIIGSVVTAVLDVVSTAVVVDAAVRNAQAWQWGDLVVDFPWLLLLVGIGVTSMARVMAYARLLQDDVEGLV